MTDIDITRRRLLLVSGGVLTVGLAGCLGDDDDDDVADDEEDTLEDHLEDANNYDGEFADHTGEETVEVIVTSDNNNSFDPAALEIDAGTTVMWEWVDDGHSVTHVEDEFDSGTQDTGYEFEHTFDDAGDYPYICVPHEGQGHLGGIRVLD